MVTHHGPSKDTAINELRINDETVLSRCVKKSCPSLSQWTGKKCGGTLKIGKDRCGCESIECGKLMQSYET
jgi:hypothetical protein